MDKVGGPNYRAEVVKDANDYPEITHYNVPLLRDTTIIERPADQNTITRRYTEEAVRFIRSNKDRPFFVYLPHSMSHIPLFVSEPFRGKSIRGLYGDVVEEIDWSVGRILDTLRELKLEQKTLVVYALRIVADRRVGIAGDHFWKYSSDMGRILLVLSMLASLGACPCNHRALDKRVKFSSNACRRGWVVGWGGVGQGGWR